jgi:hypothetical protein
MSHQITLNLPDDIYQPLLEKAQGSGKTLEALVSEYIVQIFHSKPGYGRVRRWAGALTSDVPDAGTRHDEYLGEALLEELRGGPNV